MTPGQRRVHNYCMILARKFKSPTYSFATAKDGRGVVVTLTLPKNVRRPRAPF